MVNLPFFCKFYRNAAFEGIFQISSDTECHSRCEMSITVYKNISFSFQRRVSHVFDKLY